MKKVLLAIVFMVVLTFGGLRIADAIVMSGEDYYLQITDTGEKKAEKSDSGERMVSYDYSLIGFDKNGQEKEMSFTAFKDRPLIQGAYLKVTWNQKRGVTSYKQVQENEIPTKAKEKLDGGN
ncbi:amino acid ABC transporter ATP-binding protein [Tetragenococcus halophilus subsp. flandriensis]|uniref:YxeA family protein n=1 Tax=Tetragenococcus halophilus TaxID=51669 RepID=UPI0023E9C8EE|nr:YxeA family protein [Tetragenococcus halophilus]GMA08569.1 amino acid ABC transporter ATP-binding protein [Tetragenococcus halophilus subsp. flandriensis]